MSSDAPTIEERYAVATSTKNMRVRGPRDKDRADIVMASGFAKGRGALFARLRAEFDLAHAEYRGKVSAIDARLLACMRMPSIKAGKAEVLAMAVDRQAGFDPAALGDLSWQALSGWLDPNCGRCEGRGSTGGYDGPQVLCTACKGSGKRRGSLGKTEVERHLVERLIVCIEESVQSHAAQTAKVLRKDEG